MNTWLALLTLGAVVGLLLASLVRAAIPRAPYLPPLPEAETLLWAIRQRESGDDPRAIGRRGERSAYQFLATTWREHTRQPFLLATTQPALAHAVAHARLSRIQHALHLRGLEPAPEFIAAAWNFGPAFALSAARSDYARAVAALYHDRLAQLSPSTP